MQKLMSAQDFDETAKVAKKPSLLSFSGKANDVLREIYELLSNFHNPNKFPKHKYHSRQVLLADLANKCNSYAGPKPQTNIGHMVSCLGQQAATRAREEQEKTGKYGAKLNEGEMIDQVGRRKGVDIKGDNKFERAMKPGAQAPGAVAYRMLKAEDGFAHIGIGTTAEQAYMLRQALKSLGPTGMQDLGLRPQHYFGDAERDWNRTTVVNSCLKNKGMPLSTQGVNGVPKHHCIYAMSLGGELYTLNYDNEAPGAQINHSSLLGGRDVLCAGTIRTDPNGYIIDITNASGHYLPGLYDLVDCIKQLIHVGKYNHRNHPFMVTSHWDDNLLGCPPPTRKECNLRAPVGLFFDGNAKPRDPTDFAGHYAADGDFKYWKLELAKYRRCLGPMGQSE